MGNTSGPVNGMYLGVISQEKCAQSDRMNCGMTLPAFVKAIRHWSGVDERVGVPPTPAPKLSTFRGAIFFSETPEGFCCSVLLASCSFRFLFSSWYSSRSAFLKAILESF